jgi:beta-lactam-binding protein with PASTA domain/predicted Ser/Thr protein kinase
MPNQTRLTVYSGDKKEQFESGKEKFMDEARRLAKFQDVPEIVHVYDCFEENQTAYLVMEYLEGESLEQKLAREEKLSMEQALPIVFDVLHALKAVHGAGIFHRDIAPDNIYILKEGQAKLLDFGAARFATTTHSRSLTVLIKPGFSPEEQYRSRGDQGSWTDIYALAATCYKMITGIVPEDALERAAKDKVKKPSKLGVKIGPNTEAALMNAMNVKIEDRTQTAGRFEEELIANVVKRVIVKKQTVDIGKWPFWVKAVSGTALGGIGLFAILLATGVISFDVASWTGNKIPEGKARVPNLINEEMDTAVSRGNEAGLSIQVYDKQYSEEIPENRVLSQDVKGGVLLDLNSVLGIIVSDGIKKTYVPNVLGMKSEEAVSLMKDAGFVVVKKEESAFAAPGTIGQQSLDPDTEADTGTQIELLVSTGIEGGDSSIWESVEDLIGLGYEQASSNMLEKYLYLVKTKTEYHEFIPAGEIISQNPESGSQLKQNSNISVVVSLGRKKSRVPDIQFKTEEEAIRLLEESGLSAEIRWEESAMVAVGNVIRQEIPAGEELEKESKVVLFVSTGAGNSGRVQMENESANQGRSSEQNQPAVPESVQETPPVFEPVRQENLSEQDEIWDYIGE